MHWSRPLRVHADAREPGAAPAVAVRICEPRQPSSLRHDEYSARVHEVCQVSGLGVTWSGYSAELSAHSTPEIKKWLAHRDRRRWLARWARTFQVGNSPFALLGTPVGEDCAGAVRLVKEDRLDAALSRDGAVQWLSEAEVGKRLRDLK